MKTALIMGRQQQCYVLMNVFLSLQARNIRNKPIVNRDPQSIRFEEMQTEIKVSVTVGRCQSPQSHPCKMYNPRGKG